MKIYITRHGRTIWNEEGKLQGSLDSPLTQEGIQMAKDLSKRILPYNIELIVTSDLKRAKDTSSYIRGNMDIPIWYFEELREMSYGVWDGMKMEEVYEKYGDEFEKFKKDPHNYNNGSGETYYQLVDRVKASLEKIKNCGYENVLIVSHGITVKALRIILENQPFENIGKLPVITGCTLIGYEISGDKVNKIMQEEVYDDIPM
ncbi:histidine phosphatase superfamily (branch 1) [Peptoanaerobacter stomatis]|uniref:Histidine phosphatase superfamily (Branch 1) n=1 Tax=Peptoanaerobacter stomatis TaxID=796937 RepID=J5WPF3_9FIRM|nr:histidine phosphatase family protein [Peptoanaerobacter stomatis]EJU23447.1 histidine phosphatase superfamily (branch 1) [Peptoanaerobacter stomatis]NWO24230.1 histidine phosphatase family protein [Peptostreptococcaceae bacterium oral taxon 081]